MNVKNVYKINHDIFIFNHTKPSQSDANTITVAYKRYVLGEEKNI